MSTQQSGIPPVRFSSTYPQQNFRLMELPPELVTLIEARREIGGVRLQFKSGDQTPTLSSSRTSAPTSESSPQQGFLHLCSHDKVWAVKQVSTSNSVFVTRTHEEQIFPEDYDGDVDMDDTGTKGLQNDGKDDFEIGAANRGITTIAQIKNILELIPVDPSKTATKDQILSMVYIHRPEQERDDPLGNYISAQDGPSYTFREILDNIPAPASLICRVARELFLMDDPSAIGIQKRTYALGPYTLVTAWKELIQQCTILGMKMDAVVQKPEVVGAEADTFGHVFKHMEQHEPVHSMGIDLGEFPIDVMKAILRRFKTRVEPNAESGNGYSEILHDSWDSEPLSGGWDAEALCLTIGQWILQTLPHETRNVGIQVDVFVDSFWKDLVPDVWSKFCNIDALLHRGGVDGVRLETYKKLVKDASGLGEEEVDFVRVFDSTNHVGGSVQTATSVNGVLPVATSSGSAPAPVGTAASNKQDDAKTDKKRKWHEKFGAQRKSSSVNGKK